MVAMVVPGACSKVSIVDWCGQVVAMVVPSAGSKVSIVGW